MQLSLMKRRGWLLIMAGHALVGALMPEYDLPEYDPVAKISIIPRCQAGGLTFFAPSEERLESGLYSRSYLENQMSVALGGRFNEFGVDGGRAAKSLRLKVRRFRQACYDPHRI